jgi:hypothetical protein
MALRTQIDFAAMWRALIAQRAEQRLLSRICSTAAELADLNEAAPNALADAHRLLMILEGLREDLAWVLWEKEGRRRGA